ncbi:hypothetical protein P8452_65318 [Trifolium repens]|nr:hypothetical protein P8452_65318 [Trifolium repens]
MGWLHGVKTTHNNHVYTKLSTNISPSKRKTTRTTQQGNFWVYMSFPAKNSPEKMIGSGGGRKGGCLAKAISSSSSISSIASFSASDSICSVFPIPILFSLLILFMMLLWWFWID